MTPFTGTKAKFVSFRQFHISVLLLQFNVTRNQITTRLVLLIFICYKFQFRRDLSIIDVLSWFLSSVRMVRFSYLSSVNWDTKAGSLVLRILKFQLWCVDRLRVFGFPLETYQRMVEVKLMIYAYSYSWMLIHDLFNSTFLMKSQWIFYSLCT